jgi:uncharacterized repeat protein (TIGR03803 family)
MFLLIVGIVLAPGGQIAAQTFNVLSTFDGTNGANPQGLIASGNAIYGTTSSGGSGGQGTIFKRNSDGTAFTTLRNNN